MDYPEVSSINEQAISPPESQNLIELIQEIRNLKKQTGLNFLEIGKKLKKIKEKKLYSEKGMAHFYEFLRSPEVDFSPPVAERLILLVEDEKLQDSIYLGAEKITEILKLPEDHRNRLLSEPVRISGREKKLEDLTLNELRKVSQEIKRTGKLKCDRCGRWVEHLKELDGKFYGSGSKHSCYDREIEDRRIIEENLIPEAQYQNVLEGLKETIKTDPENPIHEPAIISESIFQVYGQFLQQYKNNSEEVDLMQLEKEEEMINKLLHLLKNRLKDIRETFSLLREDTSSAEEKVTES